MIHMFQKLAIAGLFLFPRAALAGAELSFCYDPYPPYTLGQSGEPEGGTKVELLTAVTQRIDAVSARVQILPWKRCQELARSGDMDGILPLFKNEERASYLTFSEAAFLQKDSFWFLSSRFPQGLPGGGSDFPALSDLRLGMLNGGFIDEEMEAALSVAQPITRARDVPALLKLLQSNRVDLIAISEEVGHFTVKSAGLAGQIVPAASPISARYSYFGLSKASGADKYVSEFNRALAELHADGEVLRIQNGNAATQ
ncbi:hypothetical protein AB838_00980 [Rhodobacteraceae bacterium (ex Bugula neritina AB1)]|nr:hypothetical protein AB838_00980 [Rhodobacteraceae bacterium (ex Bugula neritina AB1)]